MASITENSNGTFKIRVSHKDESSGRTITKSKIFKPSKPNLPYGKLIKEVDDFAKKFEQEVKDLSANASKSITLAKFCDKYFEEKKACLLQALLCFIKKFQKII